jgi:hypothetical protein
MHNVGIKLRTSRGVQFFGTYMARPVASLPVLAFMAAMPVVL